MAYTVDDIEKILGFTSWDNSRKMNELLRIDASLYCALGCDSTKAEREQVKKHSRKIYRAIKTFDDYWGTMFLKGMDAKQ